MVCPASSGRTTVLALVQVGDRSRAWAATTRDSHGSVRDGILARGANRTYSDWCFALHHAGQLVASPLATHPDGLPDLRDLRRRLDDFEESIDHLVVVLHDDGCVDLDDLRHHALVSLAGKASTSERIVQSNEQVANLLDLPAALDCADVRPVIERDLGLALPDDLAAGLLRAVAFAVAGHRETARRDAMVRVIAAPIPSGSQREGEDCASAHTDLDEAVPRSNGGAPAGRTRACVDPALARIRNGDESLDARELLSIPDLITIYGMSRSAAYRLGRVVPSHRLPGVGLRFARADIDAWLSDHRRVPCPPSSPRRKRMHGMQFASGSDDDEVVFEGMTRRQLKEKAGW